MEADLDLSQAPAIGGDCAAVNLAGLDDLALAELVVAPVELEDGKASRLVEHAGRDAPPGDTAMDGYVKSCAPSSTLSGRPM